MLTIRLTRKGKKNQPFFRVVLIDKRRSAKGGRAVEALGNVDPLTKRKNLKKDRILYWISKGAQTSDTVHNLLISEKIIEGKKIHVSKLSKKKQADLAAQAGIAKEKSAKSGGVSDTPPAKESKTAEAKALETGAPVEILPAPVEPAAAETPAEPEKPAEPASAESSGEAKQPPTA